jgi:uncharacterized protein YcfJ
MNKLLATLLLTVLIAAPAMAQEGPPPPPPPSNANMHYGWADVLRVDPIYQNVRVQHPQQQCYEQPVVHEDNRGRTAGTVIGAIVGGVLGNTVGKGDGRKAATVAGAVAGGAIGNRVGSRSDGSYESTQTQCRNVNTVSEERRIVAYSVEYRYRGDIYVSRLPYDPGDRLRIRISVSPAD